MSSWPGSTGSVFRSGAQAQRWCAIWRASAYRGPENDRLRTVRALKRWLSLRGYGLVTSTLFRATSPPLKMRARFERLSRVSRKTMQRKFPRLVFADHAAGEVGIESVCAVESPARAILYLH